MPKGKISKLSSDHAYGRLTAYDEQTGAVRAVVEAPRGCQNKYKLDEQSGLFYLHKVLPEGMSFPLDFGYVPGTLADDGDPIDVLVFTDHATITGAVARVRLIGVIMAEQRSVVEPEWKKNHRLLGVAVVSHSHQSIRRIEDLEPGTVDDLEDFFITYNKAQGKQFNVLGRGGVEVAHQLLRDAIETRAAKIAQQEEEELLGPNVIPLRAGVFKATIAKAKPKKTTRPAKAKKSSGVTKSKAKPKKSTGTAKPKAKPKKSSGATKPKKSSATAKPKARAKPKAKSKKLTGATKPKANSKKLSGAAKPKAKAKPKKTTTKKVAGSAKKVTKKKKATNSGAIKRARKATSI